MLDNERGLYIAHCANGALSITGKMANRHGLTRPFLQGRSVADALRRHVPVRVRGGEQA